MSVQLNVGNHGPMELEREDGWFYRLHGIVDLKVEYEYDDLYSFDMTCVRSAGRPIVTATVRDVRDETLDSIRALRDAFPDATVAIETYH